MSTQKDKRISTFYNALKLFAEEVKDKFSAAAKSEPEENLRTPTENLLKAYGQIESCRIICGGESLLTNRLGKPDYAISIDGSLAGYIELKAPGTGVTTSTYKGHNLQQWQRFALLPNILYSDGKSWALYSSGELAGDVVCFQEDLFINGKKSITYADASKLFALLNTFIKWSPIVPIKDGLVNLDNLAIMIAPLCRLIKDFVMSDLKNDASRLDAIAIDLKTLLLPNASEEQIADTYAQTITFALLLSRIEGANPLTIDSAIQSLENDHALLSKALQMTLDNTVRDTIEVPLSVLLRLLNAISVADLTSTNELWLYFYERFLSIYDDDLRKRAGAFYTPYQIVHAQVGVVEDILKTEMGISDGYLDSNVTILDPAVGTGTYLLGVIEHAEKSVSSTFGQGAVPQAIEDLANRLFGFEIMVGPYAVADLRISQSLQALTKKPCRANIYLTDTLEDPNTEPERLITFFEPITKQHKEALAIKRSKEIKVCIGNPPYGKHKAKQEAEQENEGNWVRFGSKLSDDEPILEDFIEPLRAFKQGGSAVHLYNLYVYFFRWALWKVFENSESNDGIVSFITASSFLKGNPFIGMRQYLRQTCDDIWIIDLGGDGRADETDNVFNILTPVAITFAVKKSGDSAKTTARVKYCKISGTVEGKLTQLDSITKLSDLQWIDCPDKLSDPFTPVENKVYSNWPSLKEIMPVSYTGVKASRSWIIAPNKETLSLRWRKLIAKSDDETKAKLHVMTRDRKINKTYRALPPSSMELPPINTLDTDCDMIEPIQFAYKPFDRQYIIPDNRLMDSPSPELWRLHNVNQVYLTTASAMNLSVGPACLVCAEIPNIHHFRGSYGSKDIYPFLCETSPIVRSNIDPNLIETLTSYLGELVSDKQIFEYVYAITSCPHYLEIFVKDINNDRIRIPFTKNRDLFLKMSEIGNELIWLHTYGKYAYNKKQGITSIPIKTKCTSQVLPKEDATYRISYDELSNSLCIGKGVFTPVSRSVYDFEISGYNVLHNWISARLPRTANKAADCFDLEKLLPITKWTSDFTKELVYLISILENSTSVNAQAGAMLDQIISTELLSLEELMTSPTQDSI